LDNNLFILADKLRSLREEKDDHTAILKEITSEIAEVETELVTAMVDEEVPNFTRGDKQFVMTTKTHWSPEKDRKEELYAVLKEYGHEELFTVNSQTLSSFVKEQVEETERGLSRGFVIFSEFILDELRKMWYTGVLLT
jgi:NAD-specific glutamate dehydrogenase